nr:hypothetical protein [Tanacetum cinerariifolium]
MTTPTVTSSTDSQMHNNIMAAGSKDRPPMLATGQYPQWRSRFLRYIDTRPNGDALRKCILSGPYKPTTVLVQAVAVTYDSPAIPEHTTVETPMNMSLANKAHFEAEKEAIHLILTGIGDEIYLTVDACQTAQEMWEAIERLQQGESLNIQDPEWSTFMMIVKQQHKLDEVSHHKLFDIPKQYKKEVNELRPKRLARNANPLALVATAQSNQDPYYQTSKSHKSYAPLSKPSIPTRTHTTTRYKGKEIAKPITPPSETAFEKDIDLEQAKRDKDMQKNLALITKYFKKIYKPTNNNIRTSSNSRNKNMDTTPRKPKRVKDSTYHKEKMLLCKQAEKGVPLQAGQYDWLADTDEEIDEHELEAHYNYMAKIQEVPTADSGTNPNLKLLCNFVEKFLGTVRFGNDQFAPILGYGDLVQGNITINKDNDLLTGNRGFDLYTISLQESTSSTPLFLMAKASPTQAWLTDAHDDDADIRLIYDEEPMAKVQTTAEINVFAIGQQHTEQTEFNNEEEVDQNAEDCLDTCPLPAKLTDNQIPKHSYQSLESKNICLKKSVAQFQKDFSRMEAHCVNLEIKYQNHALKEGQQSQFLKEKSNEANVKHDIDVLETTNIELEHKLAKL